jgi:hypothetical protein
VRVGPTCRRTCGVSDGARSASVAGQPQKDHQ